MASLPGMIPLQHEAFNDTDGSVSGARGLEQRFEGFKELSTLRVFQRALGCDGSLMHPAEMSCEGSPHSLRTSIRMPMTSPAGAPRGERAALALLLQDPGALKTTYRKLETLDQP